MSGLQRLLDMMSKAQLKQTQSALAHIEGYEDACSIYIPGIINTNIVLNGEKGSMLIRVTDCHWTRPSTVEVDGFVYDKVDPDECIIRATDYNITAVVTLECYTSPDPDLPKTSSHEGLTLIRRWFNHPYFLMPCMIGSKFCSYSIDTRANPLDGGSTGCFVISGQIKHLIMPTHQRKNVVLTKPVLNRGIIEGVQFEIRSSHPNKLRATSTLRGIVTHQSITLQIPFLDISLSVWEICLLLNNGEPMLDIMSLLTPFKSKDETWYKIVEHILHISTKRSLAEISAVCDKDINKMLHIGQQETLPHAITKEKKLISLGLCIYHSSKVLLGEVRASDRDSAVYTRISGAVSTMCEYFRTLHNTTHLPRLVRVLQVRWANGYDVSGTLPSYFPTGNNTLSSRMRAAILTGKFTQSLGDDPLSRSNLIQTAQKMNPAATAGHLAKTLKPVNREGKDVRARQMGGDFFHVFDVADSTEGATCGLLNGRCNLSIIRKSHDPSVMYTLIDRAMSQLKSTADAAKAWVLVDGTPLWQCDDAFEFCKVGRSLRRSGVLPSDMGFGIAPSKHGKEDIIRVTCDRGEVLSPMLVEENLPSPQKVTALLKVGGTTAWNELVGCGAIEYVGSEEVLNSNLLVAETPNLIQKGKHEWSEIDPALSLLGPSTVFTPCSDRNQGPRNSYHANMKKQAHGPSCLTGENHETLQYSLDYPQVTRTTCPQLKVAHVVDVSGILFRMGVRTLLRIAAITFASVKLFPLSRLVHAALSCILFEPAGRRCGMVFLSRAKQYLISLNHYTHRPH